MTRAHTVICTAGHIDHGKSALIISLTGYDPDRLKEEQEREMTTDLGFAFYGDRVTFIDVPGHEKFLKTMLAGASSVDGAMLVVAADDGVMPQTREHLDVLKLMGVERGVIVLTKIDLVDRDWTLLVREEICKLVAGTFLENAPIVPVSNRSGEGFDELKAVLDELIASATPRSDRGLFRMWLDRAFTMKGSGTVVAGTVLSGTVRVGERVEILPQGTSARVKRIQVHKQDVPAACLGERAALNLPGVDKGSVKRGNLLATPEHYRPTYMLNARLHILDSTSKALDTRTRIRLHLGTSEHIGRAIALDGKSIEPGGSGLVQFRLEDMAMADIGDRYVVRSFSEGRVIGGGTVLEIHPQKIKYADAAEVERLRHLESTEPAEIVKQFIEDADDKTADAAGLARQLALPVEQVIDIIGALQRDGEVRVLQPAPKWQVVSARRYEELLETLINHLGEFHRRQTHLRGARRSDLKSQLMPGAAPLLFDRLTRDLADRGDILVEGEMLRLAGHRVSFTPEQEELKEKVTETYRTGKFVTPEPAVLAGELRLKLEELEQILTGLCELGILAKLYGPDGRPLYYHRDAIEEARGILLEFFKEHTEMRFFEFRQLLGSTRKFTTPILMHFDNIGLTYREGDVRRLRFSN